MLDFRRVWTGPTYARRLAEATMRAGAEIVTGTAVTGVRADGMVAVAGPEGLANIPARAVLVATGIREMSRAARTISGSRPWGVLNTGAFQDMVAAGSPPPFRAPVVVGTEWVAFSALLTARHARITPVAMIEEAPRILAHRPADLVARLGFGVPVLLRTRLIAIEGGERVEAVRVERDGRVERIACDGVVLSGRFVPEATLVRGSGFAIDSGTGGPVIDSAWRCGDGVVFAAGNAVRPVEHSGFVAREGREAAHAMRAALAGALPPFAAGLPVEARGALRYAYPQRLVRGGGGATLHARAMMAHVGWLRLLADGRAVDERRVRALPERRLCVEVAAATLRDAAALTVELA
jgi:thioredoxin reductase